MASPSGEQRIREEPPTTKEMLHKTKLVQFLGRTTPIILQNDNGPCPLLAICNLLLLRNNLNLSSEIAEVSQEKLLSLVAERLIDSNSNVNNKDAGYVENQQQNIGDAIDLLPRLATGIDVNIKFTRINDFEFTRECAIFDLLDIPLYHGWIVDPQDFETSNAIGLKSYNTLMGELVALETQHLESAFKKNPDGDCVADSPIPVPDEQIEEKRDIEEEEAVLRALKLSETINQISENVQFSNTAKGIVSESSNVACLKKQEAVGDVLEVDAGAELHESCKQEHSAADDLITFETVPGQDVSSSKTDEINTSASERNDNKDGIEKTIVDLVKTENITPTSSDPSPPADTLMRNSGGDEKISDQSISILTADVNEVEKTNIGDGKPNASSSSVQMIEESKSLSSSADRSEPVYGGEGILEMDTKKYEDRGTAVRQGELITNFLKSNASQLTIHGLFCLQEGLKERELCVFFRNNHFNTMFKFEGELYLLATDQGYINQPDLVWEKLNEVNGDTVFVTNSFKEFKAENHEPHSWDEQNAMTNTADYLAGIDNKVQSNTSFNSDLQLAIALQQQEFEQQQQPQRVLPQPPVTTRSGLVVGPQHVHPSRPRNVSSSSRQEPKPSKEKCTVM